VGVEENKALVLRFYEEVWNKGNVEVTSEIFAQDYVRHDLRPSQALPGPAGQAKVAADFRAAFPDLRMEVELILGEGDLVAARWTTEGTNSGPWGGRPPAGKRAQFSGVNIFRFRDGKVASSGTTGTTSGSCSSSAWRSTPALCPPTVNDGGRGGLGRPRERPRGSARPSPAGAHATRPRRCCHGSR
jgi:steroid delta-isomerase-like uncharacterized protein